MNILEFFKHSRNQDGKVEVSNDGENWTDAEDVKKFIDPQSLMSWEDE
jgi:hypothetical protein